MRDSGDTRFSHFTAEDWRSVQNLVQSEAPPPPVSRAAIAINYRQRARRLLERMYEAVRLYEPLPLGQQFHACNAVWRLADGSNRAGKTLCASMEAVYALLGCHPNNAYPRYNGKALFVGLETKHLALMYQTMFRPGAFQIIPDEHTHLMRSVRYDKANPTRLQEYDLAYREKWRDAPPLIPPRMIRHINWETSNEVPAVIELLKKSLIGNLISLTGLSITDRKFDLLIGNLISLTGLSIASREW